MLAVQPRPPRMGSSQPPSDDLLFGYGFEARNKEPLPEAPEPAPGDPLLTETDSRLLSSFFDDITADQYNMPSFGEGLNFSSAWYDLPPQFMGSSTSLGQQPDMSGLIPPALALPNGQSNLQRQNDPSNMMPPPPPPASHMVSPIRESQYNQHHQQQHHHNLQQHSDDVLQAAALLQNGASSRSDQSIDYSSRRAIGPPVGHLRHQPMEEFKEEARRANMTGYPDDNTFVDWMGTAGSQPQRSFSRPVALPDFQWGSDVNFTPAQAYSPGVHKDSVESHQRTQLSVLDCLEPSRSGDNTRPSSPRAADAKAGSNTRHNGLKPPEDAEAPPRKRRKSKLVKTESSMEDQEEAEPELSTSKSSRRRKPKSESSLASSPPAGGSDTAAKRRAAAAAKAKAGRENLTEDQKRENHIRSEQKRRTLIKEGFDDLCELIPGLSSRGLSKSTMLSMAGDYLEQLLKGNKELEDQLAGLERSG